MRSTPYSYVEILASLSVLLLAVILFLSVTRAVATDQPDWAEISRDQVLQPCFGNAAMVNLQAKVFADQLGLDDEARAALAEAGRIIPEGHHEGIVVPERCFAVASGLGGLNVTFWQRPDADGDTDMSIPYWIPAGAG